MIYQKQLEWYGEGEQNASYSTISHAKESLTAKYIFPFFNPRLTVVLLMVDTKDNNLVFLKPVYFRHKTNIFDLPSFVCYQPLKEIPYSAIIADQLLRNTYHFDPWQVLKKRGAIPSELKEAVVQTNIAGLKLVGKKIINIGFNDSLTFVEGIKVKKGLFTSELITRNELLLNKPEFEK